MELRWYFNVLKRRWWLLIVGMIIPMSISYYFVSRQPVLYQAKVTLQAIPHQEPLRPKTRAQAYTVQVKRRPITQAVIQRLNLEKAPEELARQITAWISPEAQLLEIMVTDTNPQAAALIANALADELIKQSLGSVEDSQRRREFVQAQLADLEVKIKDVESEIQELNDSLPGLTPAAEVDEVQRRISSLEAVAADYRGTYASLSERLQSSANIPTVIEPAVEPTRPVSSRSKLILPVAGAVGLALAAVFVILAECLASRVQDRGAGLRSKTGLFKRERLGRISAATPDKPYTITVKLYDGDELWASGEIRFHVADAPSCGGGSEEPDECDGPCPVRE
jgi:succinoglycan biosynthesis transport protein ExoP